MGEIRWIKLPVDLFDSNKLFLLEHENPKERDSAVCVFVKLYLKAAALNGTVAFDEETPFTIKKLSLLLNRKEKQVQKAIELLKSYKLIEVSDNFFIEITDWDNIQASEGIEKVRTATRERVRKCRELKKNRACNVTPDVTVTNGNATDIEKSKEEMKKDDDDDLEKRKETKEFKRYKDKLQKLDKIKDSINSERYAELKGFLDKSQFKDFDNGLITELESLTKKAA